MVNPANTPWVRLQGTAAGTVSILAHNGNFQSYTVGTATTGTVILYDSSGTAEGTSATAQMISYTGAVVQSQPAVYVKHGLLAVVSGTVDALVSAG